MGGAGACAKRGTYLDIAPRIVYRSNPRCWLGGPLTPETVLFHWHSAIYHNLSTLIMPRQVVNKSLQPASESCNYIWRVLLVRSQLLAKRRPEEFRFQSSLKRTQRRYMPWISQRKRPPKVRGGPAMRKVPSPNRLEAFGAIRNLVGPEGIVLGGWYCTCSWNMSQNLMFYGAYEAES